MKNLKVKNLKIRLLILAAAMFWGLSVTGAAQTSAFTYQGRFTDSAVAQPTNGTYNMQFALFDAAANGNQVGAPVIVPNVQVVNGIFTVTLDYTAASFDGAPRFLQVTVANTVLNPRQEITSAPYAIAARKALLANDSNKLGGIDADQYVTGQVVRSVNSLTNNVTLAAGSNITITPSGNTLTIASTGGAGGGSGINNQTSLQAGANFNIDGTGAAKIFNAATQFNLGGNRFLSGGSGNVFAGESAGAVTTGGDNAFVGTRAGLTNTAGFNNSFFGTDAGHSNTANDNSFFGRSAGYDNSTGTQNAFFAEDAGRFNTLGSQNSFFGFRAGQSNTSASENSFFGSFAGQSNKTGFSNSFFGRSAGNSNVDGVDNSIFGHGAGQANISGSNNSLFGSDAGRSTTADNNSFFGRSAGFDNTLGTRNVFVGVDAGRFNQTGGKNSFFGTAAGSNNLTGANNTVVGDSANVGANNLNFATALGSGAIVSTSNTVVLGRTADTVVAPNLLQVGALGATGSTVLCRNAANQIATCSAGSGTGGGSFIENSTAQQPNAFFNISGSGTLGGSLTANLVNSATHYRIAGSIVLGAPNPTSVVVGLLSNYNLTAGNNAFLGYKAGAAANNTGQGNVFVGSEAGTTNSNGAGNSFVGRDAGFFNTSGSANSFFGNSAGKQNTTASFNSFFGTGSGGSNIDGSGNSYFGFHAGELSTSSDNSFFGYKAGQSAKGFANTFIGSGASSTDTDGSQNTAVGSGSGTSGSKNAAIGYRAGSGGTNSVAMGSNAIAGGGEGNTAVGASSKARGNGNTAIGTFAQIGTGVTDSTAIGTGAVATSSNSIVLGAQSNTLVEANGALLVHGNITGQDVNAEDGKFTTVKTLLIKTGLAGSETNNDFVCISSLGYLATCGHNGVRPQEDKSEALSSSVKNQNAQIEAQIEAQAAQIKAQQTLIERQAEQFKQQQLQIEALKQIVCSMNPAAQICTVK